MTTKELEELKKLEESAAACNRCGFCTSYCPTYRATGQERHSPRGRVQAFRAVVEGKLTDPSHIDECVNTCLLCGECTSICFSEVPTANLMVQARHYLNQKKGLPRGLTFFLNYILKDPKKFSRLLKISFFFKRIGVSSLLRKMGMLKKFSPELHAADALVETVPSTFLLDEPETKPLQPSAFDAQAHYILEAKKKVEDAKKKGAPVSSMLEKIATGKLRTPSVLYMPVCGSQYIRPKIGLSTIGLLKQLKIDSMIPDVSCCGLPAASYGVLKEEQEMAMSNIKMLEAPEIQTVLVDDSSCFAHLKDYAKIFPAGSPWLSRAQAVVQKMRDVPTFLSQEGLIKVLGTKKWTKGPVAFHDPCKAQYGLKSVDIPRQLIRAVPGIDLRDVPDADQCCGGAGTYSMAHPELSQEVLKEKVKNLASTGAKTIITSSTSCLIQVAFGLRQKHPDIRVLHLTEFLAEVLDVIPA